MSGRRKPVMPRVGIVGAGQLARMTYAAAIPLGLRLRIFAAKSDESAAVIAARPAIGSPEAYAQLAAFAADCDIVTFDHEVIDPRYLSALEAGGNCLRPSASAQLIAQDKLYQRRELMARGFPVPHFSEIADIEDVAAFGQRHGWPVILKVARGGYDGRGVWTVGDASTAAELLLRAREHGRTLFVEERLAIEQELAILVARRPRGDVVLYPVVETVQVGGICREVRAPAHIAPGLATQVACLAREIAAAVNGVGIIAIEFFVVHGTPLINELAMRPHNSGHYSIEGCITSQFTNHLRAVLDWPLGEPGLVAPAVVSVNVLGREDDDDPRLHITRALELSDVHIHLYDKSPKAGRKLGHVTALGSEIAEVRKRAWQAATLLGMTPLGEGSR